MSLVDDGQLVGSPQRHPDLVQPHWDPRLPDLTLGPVAAADLVLVLAGVLPHGHRLGGPVGAVPAGPPGRVAVTVASSAVLTKALAVGGIILRDEENTPLAVLGEVAADTASPGVLTGIPQRLRARESGSWAASTIDFDDPRLRGRPLLFMGRPATSSDVAQIRAWAGGLQSLLVLVPEHSGGLHRVPTAGLLQLASQLVEELGDHGAEIFTVPFEEHDEISNAELVDRIATRLAAADTRRLTDSTPAASAAQWIDARHVLVAGADSAPPAFFSTRTRAVLDAWLPRRTARGLVLMFTGLSGSGKSTLARDVSEWLANNTSRTVTLLDGDRVRQLLSSGLGFDPASREVNVRRIGFVAAEVARHGGIAICSPIAPFAATRAEVRQMVERVGDFVLIHVSTPLDECERRDLKGLYARARLGEVAEFTGISSPYEAPLDADLQIDTSGIARDAAAQRIIDFLRSGGWLGEAS